MIIIINILAIICSFFAGLFINHYYPKYMGQKGKNLATKEDIGEITKIVESIKTDLANDTEVLKAKLSVEGQHAAEVNRKRQSNLIDYYEKFSAYLEYLQTLSGMLITSTDEILYVKNTIFKLEYEYIISKSKIELFENDQDFIMDQANLHIFLNLFKSDALAYLIRLSALIVSNDFNTHILLSDEELEKYKSFLNEIQQLLADFRLKKKNDYLENVQNVVNVKQEIKKRFVENKISL